MPNQPSKKIDEKEVIYTLKERLSLVLTFSVGIALLVLAQIPSLHGVESKASELFFHLSGELGVALIIGGYLSITIEKLTQIRIQNEMHNHMKRVGDNFIQAVYGKDLPSKLFQIVKSSIFEQSFVKTSYWNHIYLYDFEKYLLTAPENVKGHLEQFKSKNEDLVKDRVILTSSASYTVMNVSAKPKSYPIILGMDKPFGGKYLGLCGITSLSVNGKDQIPNEGCFSSNTPDKLSDDSLLQYQENVNILPGESLDVTIEAYSLRNNDDHEAWFTAWIQNGIRITVADANNNKDISIRFGVPHLMEGERFVKKNPRTNTATLESNQYFMPGQGFIIKWKPKAESSPLKS